MADEGIDLLWTTRNAFYVGAYQAAIAEAADLDGLGDADKLERDVFVYRAYVELGSYEVRLARCMPERAGYPGVGAGPRGEMDFFLLRARHWARERKKNAPLCCPRGGVWLSRRA
jgi:hypothetical protein